MIVMIAQWWDNLKYRRSWRYAGTVEAITRYTKDGKAIGKVDTARWVLEERADGKRRATQIGTAGISPYAIAQSAAVKAWIVGGPLPSLVEGKVVPAKPERKKAQLICFPGGKAEDTDHD